MDIDVRAYIINNFKNDSTEEIRKSIEESIASLEDDPLIGLGVLLELAWNNSDENTKLAMLNSMKKGM